MEKEKRTVYFFNNMGEVQKGYVKRIKEDRLVVISNGQGWLLEPDRCYPSEEALVKAKHETMMKKIPDEKALVKTLFELIRDMCDGADLDEYAYRAAREKAGQLYRLPKKTFMNI